MNTVPLVSTWRYRFGWLYGGRTDFLIFIAPFVLMSALYIVAVGSFAYSLSLLMMLGKILPSIGNFHSGAT